jgi:hypothetical protein
VTALGPAHRVARAAGLLGFGALALHQLRYALAFGAGAGAELHHEGHAYLAEAAPILVAVGVATVIAASLAGALGACRGAPSSWSRRTLLYALSLLAVFSAQELTEGALSAGHPDGIHGLVGHGGWLAVPLALLLGGLAALVARLLDRVEDEIGAESRRRPAFPEAPPAPPPATASARAPMAALGLAFGLARRPPPALRAR